MNIVGLDSLVFGVDDVDACSQYLVDYGLTASGDGVFEAVDGTSVVIKARDDASLPAALETGAMLRKTVYGVADEAALEAIVAELETDREVKRLDDGSVETFDDLGFALGFRVTVRREFSIPGERVNSPGRPVQRPANDIGADPEADPKPLTLSHVVYFVPDVDKAEAFYEKRLGFITTDRFKEAGPFMRPAGTLDHHSLFMIHTPPFMQGCEHFTFHMSGPNDLLLAGTRFAQKGYEIFWGPGRHLLGSNWFWYFNSPMGVHVEYDADMDLHDDNWVPREYDMNADKSQLFLFTARDKWAPSGPEGQDD